MKSGAFSKVEKFYIENHAESLTTEEIAKALDRSEETIQKYVEKLPNKTPKKKEEKTKKPQKAKKKGKRSQMDNLMGHKERNNERVATIMTPAASEYSDSKRKGRKKKNMDSIIHKPKG